LPIKDIAEKGRSKGLDVDMDGACPGMNGITEPVLNVELWSGC
jgi:hypothetical protein